MITLEKFRDYIDRVRKETGLGPTAIAQRAGLASSTVNRPLTPGYALTPSAATVMKIEQATGVAYDPAKPLAPRASPPAQKAPSARIPIVGGARGGDWENMFFDQGAIQGHAQCPPSLADVPDAFAVYVVGESMQPKFEPGTLLYVNPTLPPAPGRYVVIDMADNRAVVKQYLRRDAAHLVVRQLNPPEEMRLPVKDIKGVYRIVGSEEP